MKQQDIMRALIDAYIELGERASFSKMQIVDSLTDIFDQEELKELGYGEYIQEYFEAQGKEGTWICVYKDALGYQDDLDNLTTILVPTEWLVTILENKGEELQTWLSDYTADNTDDIARVALRENVILDCSEKAVKEHLETMALDPKAHETRGWARTSRGAFRMTEMTKEKMEEAGYHYHHSSEDGKVLIMTNGTKAYAILAQQEKNQKPTLSARIDSVGNRPWRRSNDKARPTKSFDRE